MKLFLGNQQNAHKVVLSLCDYSGKWPSHYHALGYTVICADLKHGDDVTDTARIKREVAKMLRLPSLATRGARVVVVLAAPPCTDFTVSGAQYWPAKDADGRTAASLRVVDACLALVKHYKPKVWALENPVGRLPKLRPDTLGRPVLYFNPCDYAGFAPDPEADRYTKKTGLWGVFSHPEVARLEPIRACKQGSWIQQLGGKSERTKELRSMTPLGFSRAFCEANLIED